MKTSMKNYAHVANKIVAAIENAQSQTDLDVIYGMIDAFSECFDYDIHHQQMVLTLKAQFEDACDRVEELEDSRANAKKAIENAKLVTVIA